MRPFEICSSTVSRCTGLLVASARFYRSTCWFVVPSVGRLSISPFQFNSKKSRLLAALIQRWAEILRRPTMSYITIFTGMLAGFYASSMQAMQLILTLRLPCSFHVSCLSSRNSYGPKFGRKILRKAVTLFLYQVCFLVRRRKVKVHHLIRLWAMISALFCGMIDGWIDVLWFFLVICFLNSLP